MPEGISPPEPKTLIDSILDGVCEAVTFPSRALTNTGKVATDYAESVTRELTDIRAQTPDRPEVLLKAAIAVVGATVKAGVGGVRGVFDAGKVTAEGIEREIRRVTK